MAKFARTSGTIHCGISPPVRVLVASPKVQRRRAYPSGLQGWNRATAIEERGAFSQRTAPCFHAKHVQSAPPTSGLRRQCAVLVTVYHAEPLGGTTYVCSNTNKTDRLDANVLREVSEHRFRYDPPVFAGCIALLTVTKRKLIPSALLPCVDSSVGTPEPADGAPHVPHRHAPDCVGNPDP